LSTGPEPSGCPCEPGIDNFCDLAPKTAGCDATFPGGYCDPDGDGSYLDADFNAGFLAWKAECGFLVPPQPTSIERIECATGCVLTTTGDGSALILIEDASSAIRFMHETNTTETKTRKCLIFQDSGMHAPCMKR